MLAIEFIYFCHLASSGAEDSVLSNPRPIPPPSRNVRSWNALKRHSAPTPSNRTENDSKNSYGDPAVLYAEPEEADLGVAQRRAQTYPDARPEEHANQILQRDRSAAPDSRRSGSTSSESTLFGSSAGEKKVSHKSTCGTADDRKGCDPAPPVCEGQDKIQDSTLPQGSFTYDGATPVYLGGKPKNVILFGETGVGKSSVINLMAGKEIAKVSANLNGCTLQATEHWFGLSEDVSVRIFDTVGLEEPEIGINSFMGAMEKAHQLVQSLHCSGGIDLLLFCIRGGRITTAMQRSYRLFFEILCGSQVPFAIVVTNLERENVMEDWWVKNEKTFQDYGIHPIAHACITAVPPQVTMYAQKRAQSQRALRNMLLDTLTNSKPSYVRDIRSWFSAIIQMLRSLLVKTESLKKKDLMKRLERRCMLPHNDAEKLAHILTGVD